MKQFSAWLLLGAAVLLGGCSSSDEEEERTLPEIVNRFETQVLWQQSVGEGVAHYFSRLSPVVNGNVIYSAARNGTVAAFDVDSGERLWEVDVRESTSLWPWADDDSAKLSGGLLYAYGILYVGSEHGEVIAIDPENGAIKWKKAVPGEAISTPAAGDGLVFVNLASGILVALHPDTGEERWRYEQEVPPLTLRGISSPTTANGGVLVGEELGRLSVLIANNGFTAWKADIALPKGASEFERLVDVDTQPHVSGSNAYTIAYNGNLAAVDMRSGNVIWQREYSSYRELSLDALSIYVVDSDGVIYGLDKNSGIERWSQPALTGWHLTGVGVSGDHLVLGDEEGNLHWLDKTSGELLARSEFDSSGFFVEPVVAGEKVFIQTRDGELSAVKAP